ncbi:MAG: hypothetical protein IPJ20_09220, partial [Flammeovirgaceae bacterium]|nr:hypothetical protein [Flammeovirgaceae bacterium]
SFTVDAQGRLTTAGNTAITGVVPGGAAGGDLAGTYPNPTLAAGSGNSLVTAINNAGTTGLINTTRLNTHSCALILKHQRLGILVTLLLD